MTPLFRPAVLALVVLSLSLPGHVSRAQNPPAAGQRPDSAHIQEQMAMMSGMMGPMMGQMARAMLEGTLATLAQPESAERLATFTRNYFDALMRRGFTREEALRIVTAVGVPTPMAPPR